MNKQQLPEGWHMVKFGEIATHISKRVEPSETDLDIYVGLEHLDPESLRIKRHGAPSDVEGQKLLVKKGQIIFGKRRAYQRKLGVADWDCICSAHAMVLEANPETVLPEFLPFFMQSDVFMNRAVAVSEGSLSPTIKWKTLANQEFAIPGKILQSKINKLCEKIIHCLLAVEKSLASSNKLLSVLKEEYFEEHNGNAIKFSSLFDVRSGKGFKQSEYSEAGLKLLRIDNVSWGKTDWGNTVFLPEKYKKINPELILSNNDIVLALNRPITQGKLKISLLTEQDMPAILYQRVGLISSLHKWISPALAFHILSHHIFRYVTKESVGSDQPFINLTGLRNSMLHIPEKEKLLGIENTLEKLRRLIHRLETRHNELFSIMKWIINQHV